MSLERKDGKAGERCAVKKGAKSGGQRIKGATRFGDRRKDMARDGMREVLASRVSIGGLVCHDEFELWRCKFFILQRSWNIASFASTQI